MSMEQDATLTGLKTALQMEIDGKEFYLKASKASRNELGSKLLKQLAAEEDVHREVFKNIYDSIKKNNKWPDIKYTPDSGKKLRTVFKEAIEKMDKSVKSKTDELEDVKTAMGMENETLVYYNKQSSRATHKAEKGLYDALVIQEREHYRLLVDYFEFFNDPAEYFVKTEHTSVDGG